MRLNRGTLVLVVVLLVALVVILLVNTNQMSAPGVTPTSAASEVSGALLPNVPAENIVRYEIRDNNTGQFTALTKDAGGAWQIEGTNVLLGRDPDQNLISTTAGQIVTINYSNTFEDDDLVNFGLDHPLYTILVLTNDGTLYTIYIGNKQPTAARYYAVVDSATGQVVPDTESSDQDATGESDAAATETTAGENANEEGVMPLDGTAESFVATDEAAAPTEAPEATAEATTEGSAKRILRQATEEPSANAEATMETTPVDNVASQAENNGAVEVEPAPTVEVTFDPSSFTPPPPTAESTGEVTPEATANLIGSPQVTLSGSQTIYLIPQTVLDTLKNWLAIPPYAPLPTGVPTNEAATPEASAESTMEAVGAQGTVHPTDILEEGSDPNLVPAGTAAATQGTAPAVTPVATNPASANATAEATAAS